jgi:hypothetical protein
MPTTKLETSSTSRSLFNRLAEANAFKPAYRLHQKLDKLLQIVWNIRQIV